MCYFEKFYFKLILRNFVKLLSLFLFVFNGLIYYLVLVICDLYYDLLVIFFIRLLLLRFILYV